MATLELRGIHKHYGAAHAVDGIDLTVADGEFLAILGPSGCGKSTTMRMIAGLETPTIGQVLIGDQDVTHLPPRARNVSMVFQSYALYPNMSVAKNIAFPLKARGVPKAERDARVAKAAQTMGITALLERSPVRLSGGEKQKVALARALVRDPALYVFDEPLSSLDAQVRAMARSELRQLHDRTKVTTVYVTHDQLEALGMGDRIAVMKAGRVRQVGTPKELYGAPADTFVAGFLGSPPMNLIAAEGKIIGFRPEGIGVSRAGTPVASDQFAVTARIVELEFLGSTWQIYAVQGAGEAAQKFIAHVSPQVVTTLEVGSDHVFTVPRAELHLFDAKTGLRVTA
ncbi:MAG: ABC transporter ATP-binding protein [Rhodanobacter sp.]|nr:MAG: ABC transporter ATP-binding protein [Rhodanobacter sp.]